MDGVRTRSKAVERTEENGGMNGHAHPGGNTLSESAETENIFLFYPNIIGNDPWP